MKIFKKIISFGLGICMFVTGFPKASAKIEMWTFSDGTRVSRFNYTDIDEMISFYEILVQENEKRKFTKGQNRAIKTAGAVSTLGGIGLAGYLWHKGEKVKKESKTKSIAYKIGAGLAGLAGLASVAGSFYPEYVAHKVKMVNVSDKKVNYIENGFDIDTGFCWLGLEDICTLLNLTKNKIDELRANGVENLIKTEENTWCHISGTYKLIEWKDLEKYPYFLLVERPKSVYENHTCTCPTGIYFGCEFISDEDADLRKKLARFLHTLKTSENLKIVNKGLAIKSTVNAIDNK